MEEIPEPNPDSASASLLKRLRSMVPIDPDADSTPTPPITVNEDLAAEIKRGEHQQDMAERDSDLKLKKTYATRIFILLCFELLILAAIIMFQGFGLIDIEEWTFGIFVNGVILQTFSLIKLIVKSLFSQESSKPKKNK